jgi:cell division protein FtsB
MVQTAMKTGEGKMDSQFYRKLGRRLTLLSPLRRLLRNRAALGVMLLSVTVGGFVVFGNHGVLQRLRLQQRKVLMERRIREAQEETKSLQSQSRALDSDKKAIEKVAREDYGMARSGEKVYKVQPEGR